jgi:phosphopantothenoylcysteine decarboxylase/phosphopantothenate--cysteine ligase
MLIDLKGKTILLGITGSIAAYKSCDIARLFVKSGAQVHVIMTEAAQRFVTALTMEALTGNPVLHEGTESWSSDLNHIDIGKKADIFLIAPATANTINKLSKGIADTILLQTALAYSRQILIAPAANTQMIANHYTDGSLKMLRVNDIRIISPQNKLLACGDEGNGALAEPQEIYFQACQALLEDPFWRDRKVVITGGGTREKIDEVRYISNYSSGKMAKSLATALYLRGADVCYISTMPHEDLPAEIYTIDVEDAAELLEYTVDAVRVAKKGKMSKPSLNNPDAVGMIQKTPYLYMVAAVADFTPQFPQTGKLKKSQIGEHWSIELKQTADILQSINKEGIITIGFKAEMDSDRGLENAKSLISDKGVTAVCYNLLQDSQSFGTSDNEIHFITTDAVTPLGRADKLVLSFEIAKQSRLLDKDSNE